MGIYFNNPRFMATDARRALKKKAQQVFEKVRPDDHVFVRYIGYDESEEELTALVSSTPYNLGDELKLLHPASVFLGDCGPVIRIKGMVYDVTDLRIEARDDDESDEDELEDEEDEDVPELGMEVVQPNAALGAVVGSQPLPSIEVTKKLWAYIKKNGLQDEKVKTQINADAVLRPVFSGKSSISMFELSRVIHKNVRPITGTSAND